MELFRRIFEAGTPTRLQFQDRLKFAADAMKSNLTSKDNTGEKHTYASLDQQRAG